MSRSIHVIASGIISLFFIAEYYSIVNMFSSYGIYMGLVFVSIQQVYAFWLDNPLIFKVIIDMYVLIAISLIVLDLFCEKKKSSSFLLRLKPSHFLRLVRPFGILLLFTSVLHLSIFQPLESEKLIYKCSRVSLLIWISVSSTAKWVSYYYLFLRLS